MTFFAIRIIERTLEKSKSEKEKIFKTIESRVRLIEQEESKEKHDENEIKALRELYYALMDEIDDLKRTINEFYDHDWH